MAEIGAPRVWPFINARVVRQYFAGARELPLLLFFGIEIRGSYFCCGDFNVRIEPCCFGIFVHAALPSGENTGFSGAG